MRMTALNPAKNINTYLFIQDENERKEEFLNQRIEKLETEIKELDLNARQKRETALISTLALNSYYKDLAAIDELFIKADYLDPISANLLMDEIGERIENLNEKMALNSAP